MIEMAEKTQTNDKPDISAWSAPTPRVSEWRRMLRVFFGRKLAVIGLVIILAIMIIAVFAPIIAPYNPNAIDLDHMLVQPSGSHLLGTDASGRDIFSRIVYGSRTSLMVGLISVGISGIVGMVMGIAAGYFGGWVFIIIMRITDALMAIPGLILVLLIAGLVGGGITIVIFALSFGGIAGYCRMMCAQTLSLKQNDYIMAEQSIGQSAFWIMFKHILPNAFAPILVGMTMGLGGVVLAEAGLSFLGIGILPPTAAWGSMVNDGYKYLLSSPVLSMAPGAMIMLLVFGFNMAGDGLRDAMDPRLRGVV
jgi:peptide/nickel transport system permease protein